MFERTADGGLHWRKVSLPVSIGSPMAFANPRDGCLQQSPGPGYLWTTNGGRTWRRGQSLPNQDLVACAARLVSLAWQASSNRLAHQFNQPWETWSMVAVRGSSGWVAAGQDLLHSDDYGRTWAGYAWPTTQSFPGIGYYSFINGRDGWGSTGDGRLFKTTDGGKDWTQL